MGSATGEVNTKSSSGTASALRLVGQPVPAWISMRAMTGRSAPEKDGDDPREFLRAEETADCTAIGQAVAGEIVGGYPGASRAIG